MMIRLLNNSDQTEISFAGKTFIRSSLEFLETDIPTELIIRSFLYTYVTKPTKSHHTTMI